MAGLILAAPINPDNTPHGYNLTFAFPMLLFIVIGGVLYLLFSRPHRRVPARGVSLVARSGVPGPGAARSAAVAGGLTTAPGGGASESPFEPHGAHLSAGETDQSDLPPADKWQAGGTKAEPGDGNDEPPGYTAQSPEDKE